MSILDHAPSSTVELDDRPTDWLRSLPTPGIIGVGVAAAVAANTAIWAIGALAGGSFELTDAGKVQSVAPGGVIVFTAVPLLIGLTLAALLARWRPGTVRLAQVVGSVLALGTILGTIAADFDGVSTVALALSHVVIVPVLVVALDAIGHRAPGASDLSR